MTRIALLAMFALAALPCAAQYPDRNVTFLANFPPGGLVDIVTRVMAEGMKPKFPHGITVVNKPGAGGAVGVSDLIQAKPDGYTILLTPQSSLVIAPQMNPKLSYKTPDEYDPVLHGFLALEADDLPSLCESIRQVEANKERAVIAAGSARYAVHRYCPHQGADLTEGWVEGGHLLVCPRHRWQFDLEKQGRCTLNSSSLCAERLPDNVEPLPGTVRKVEDQPQPLVALNTAS